MAPTEIRILVVDDNVLVRSGLKTLLETSDELSVIGEAGDGREAIELAGRLRPDIVLLDIRMPVLDGISALEELVQFAKVVMLTHSEEDESIQRALHAGASGYLVHGSFDVDNLVSAISDVVDDVGPPLSPVAARSLVSSLRHAQQHTSTPVQDPAATAENLGLTPREGELLALMSEGLSNADIAGQVFVSEKTVKNHVTHIYAKLGVSSRAAAIALWHQGKERA